MIISHLIFTQGCGEVQALAGNHTMLNKFSAQVLFIRIGPVHGTPWALLPLVTVPHSLDLHFSTMRLTGTL